MTQIFRFLLPLALSSACVCASSTMVLAQTRNLIPKTAARPAEDHANQDETDQQKLIQRIERLRKNAKEQLTAAERAREKAQSSNPASTKKLDSHIDLLQLLVLVYAQREAALEKRELLAEELAETTELLQQLRTAGPTEPRPYSFLLLDRIRHELDDALLREKSTQTEVEAAQGIVESTKRVHQKLERERRFVRETKGNDTETTAALEEATLSSQVSLQSLKLRTEQLAHLQMRHEISQRRATYLKEKVALISEHVVFNKQHLEEKLREIQADEQALQEHLAIARRRLQEADQQWIQIREQSQETLEYVVMTWQRARDLRQAEITLLTQRLSDMVWMRVLWQVRFDVHTRRPTAAEAIDWRTQVEEFNSRQASVRQVLESRIGEYRSDMSTLRQEIGGASPHERQWLEFRVAELRRVLDELNDALISNRGNSRLAEYALGEIGDEAQPKTAKQLIATIWSVVKYCWRFELIVVEDRPVTVGKIVFGVMFLLLGFWLARVLSRILGSRILPRLKISEGGQAALQTVAYYVLMMVFGFIGLELVNIPITVFAFLGGAVAIGVGFGSQNILNNFISGLILLAERPIRTGDLVDMDGLYGTVEQIGARSTRIRTGANLEIIVPNSKFLENNVTNLTLSDTRIRRSISVGVAYGSPTRRVAELLRQAVDDNANVLHSPEPIVLFREFGDNSLAFEVHFWIHMRTMMQSFRIESELRHEIDQLLAAADITIAFPQRDIHLDTSKPLEISLRSDVDTAIARPRRAA